MRIGMLSVTYGDGGAGTHVSSLAEILSQMGHEVVVFSGRTEKRTRESNVEVVSLGLNLNHGFPTLWSHEFQKRIQSHRNTLRRCDVINGNPVLGDYALQASRLGVPYVATLHGNLRAMVKSLGPSAHNSPGRWLLDRMFLLVDSRIEAREYQSAVSVVAVSRSVLGHYEDTLGRRQNCYIVPPCLSIPIPAPSSQKPEMRRADFPRSANLLFVGSNTDRKGIDYLLSAFELVRLQCVGARLTIVTSPIGTVLPLRVRNMGLQKAVALRQNISQEELLLVIRNSGIFVFPSLYEGCPTAVMETMTNGVPSVAFDVPGVRDLITNGLTGYLVFARDVGGFAEAVCELIRDEEKLQRMGTQAQKYAFEHFLPKTVAEQYIEVYRKTVDLAHAVAG
jgi:glycosyltransferase involved in cell wall biosynthesis